MAHTWQTRTVSAPSPLAAGLLLVMLAVPLAPAPAQGPGGGGTGTGLSGSPGIVGPGSGDRPGDAGPGVPATGPKAGQAVDDPPAGAMREQQRDLGVAPAPERAREQLRDLNEISRRLAPSVPVPAPGLGASGASR